MSYKFNPFTSNLDISGSSTSSWKTPVADVASLPASSNTTGDVRIALATKDAWEWDGAAWNFVGLVKTASVGSSPDAKGYTLGSDNTLTLQPADATHPGVVTTGSQSIAGTKTFTGLIQAAGGIDVAATGGTDTLDIGATGADVINIGHSGATVNIQGTTLYENVTNLNVTDSLITINKGAGAGSGGGAGLEIEENAIITGYAKTSVDRNSWSLLAPNTAGVATITPGAGGITLDQSSHNPLTLTAVGASPNANGASLSTQALTLQPADTSNPGVLTATDWNTFNNKQATITIGALDAQAENANGLALVANVLSTQSADATHPGVVNNTTQTFSGNKTLSGATTLSALSTGIIHSGSGGALTSSLIVNADVSASAAIVYSKLDLSNSIVNADVNTSAAIAVSKLAALTASRAVVTDGSGFISAATTTSAEIGFVNGVTSAIQTQLNNKLAKAAGDIDETSFSAANNQAAAANVTGLAFANSTVRSAKILLSVFVNATSSLYEAFDIMVIQKGASWNISQNSVGDISGFVFTITTAGQIQYTSTNNSGFTAATVKFRATTTSV